jgi:hypothetical protein
MHAKGGNNIPDYGLKSIVRNVQLLLHQRLGHPGKVRTEQVAKILGVKGKSSDTCETCIKAKFSALPFERSTSRADAPLS